MPGKKKIQFSGVTEPLNLIYKLELICSFFNCQTSFLDDEGNAWVEEPMNGHWLTSEEIDSFNAFIESLNAS